jgi:mRNA interferase RelE/StbE
MPSRYLLKTHSLIASQDLLTLPESLQEAFVDICQAVLTVDPYDCLGLPNHPLKGKLKQYRAIELDWEGDCYRLVYRIYETPSPKRVLVLSIAEHDAAYERAQQRNRS